MLIAMKDLKTLEKENSVNISTLNTIVDRFYIWDYLSSLILKKF